MTVIRQNEWVFQRKTAWHFAPKLSGMLSKTSNLSAGRAVNRSLRFTVAMINGNCKTESARGENVAGGEPLDKNTNGRKSEKGRNMNENTNATATAVDEVKSEFCLAIHEEEIYG